MPPARFVRPTAMLLLVAGGYAAGYYHRGHRQPAVQTPPQPAAAAHAPPSSAVISRAVQKPLVDQPQPFGKTAAPADWTGIEVIPPRPEFSQDDLEAVISDPRRLPGFLASLDARSIQAGIRNIAILLVNQDPAAAWAWAEHFTDPGQRSQFEAGLTSFWASTDPATAIPWLMRHHPDKLPDDLPDALKRWMDIDRGTVQAFVVDQPPGPAARILAAAWLETLTRQDPAAAVKQVDLLPAGRERNAIFGKAINRWARQDITGASTFASAMPAGPARDTAIEEILGPAFEADPGSALAWVAYLGNSDKKELYLEAYFESWHKKDPAAASAWLTQSPVDPTLRRRILARTTK